LDEDEPEIVPAEPETQLVPMNGNGRGHLNLAASIRSLRLRSGLSQRQLAGRMSVPRTYVSKIENEKATPTLSSLERLARALEVTVPDLLSGGERNRQDEIRAARIANYLTFGGPVRNRPSGFAWRASILQQGVETRSRGQHPNTS